GEAGLFRLTVAEPGRLTALAQGGALDTRLGLLGSDGALLAQSDGVSAANRDDRVVQHLPAGTYFLQVEGLGGTGNYTLTTEFVAAVPPWHPLPVPGDAPIVVVTDDFNEDGHLDLVTGNGDDDTFSLFLGLGDGTFQRAVAIPGAFFGVYSLVKGD